MKGLVSTVGGGLRIKGGGGLKDITSGSERDILQRHGRRALITEKN